MIREYEFTVIAKPDLPDPEKKELWTRYENFMTKDGGEILLRDDWGIKKLAFPIRKEFRGHYVVYDFVGKAQNLAEAERLMRIDDRVLRYLSIRLGEEVDIPTRKAELAKEKAKLASLNAEDLPPVVVDEDEDDN